MKRHLIYHITPIGTWRENIKLLREYHKVFNGHKLAVIYQGENMEYYPDIRDEIFWLFDDVFEMPNHPILRETPSLCFLLNELQRRTSDGIAFFGHTKGVTHKSPEDDGNRLESIRLWTEACYRKNLTDIPLVERTLEQYSIAGCFRQPAYGFTNFPPNCPWCFAGTFFWFDVAKMWARDWRVAIFNSRFGAEAFPGFAFPLEESFCFFGETDCHVSLYQLENMRNLLLCTPTV